MTFPVGALAALGPFIEYLRPAKSPYLLMVIFGIVAIILTGKFFHESDKWLMLATPQFIALIVFFAFAYYGKDKHTEIVQEDQLKFSRALSIAVALICLAFGAKEVEKYDALFYIIYVICVFQLVIFSIYTAARLIQEENPSSFNFFQFSCITSAFLVGATFSISELTYTNESYMLINIGEDSSSKEIVDPYFITSLVFCLLWSACQVFWVRRVVSLINISISVSK
ncbi:MAG: hypothetical protein GY775_14645 [Candidatus Scalindua sp.]|nr:hypothetical protein [Candidatus Scalindua sp.]